ncbi:UNVERIFIED_CONTAM: hypothetical protein HHA_222330 [Hammondia hammondi]|eukprot:XP_008886196.1 hypothetical protein HHA_222330 [Hammondia hammondi]
MPFSQSTVPQASFCSFQSTTTTDCNTGPASRASLDCVLPLLTQSSSLLLPPAWLAADGSAFPLLASSRAAANRSPAFLQAFGERTAGDPRVEEISEETEHEGEQPATGGTASGDGPAGLRREKVASLRGIDDACRGAGILPSQGQRSQGRESREACGEGDRQQTWRLREGERDCGTQSSLSLVSRASTSSLPPRKLRSPLIPASASSLSAHRMPVPWTAVRQAYPHVQVDPRKHAVSAYSFSSLSPKSFSPPRTPRALLNCMRQTNAPFPEPSKAAKPHRVGSRRRIGTRLTSRLLSPAEVSRQLLEQYPGPPAEAVPGEPDAENRATGVSGFFPEGKSRTEPVLPSSKGDSEKHLLHGRTTLSLASTRATRLSSSSSRLLSRLTLASLSTGKRPDSEQRRVSGIPPVRSRSDSQASGGHTPGQPPSSAPRAAYTHSPAFSRLLSRAPSLKRHSSCPRNAEATEAPVAVQPPVGERERRTLPVLSKRRVSTASRVSGVKRRDLGAPQKRDREEEGPLAGLWRLLAFPSEEGGPEVSEAESETSDTSADVEAVDAWGAALDRVDTGDPWRPHPAPPASYGTLKSLPPKSLPPKPLSSKSLSVTSLAEMREKGVVLEAAQPLRGSSKRGPVSRGSEAVHAGRSREEARKERSASLHARPCGDCDTLPGPCFGDAERDRKGTSSVKEKQPPFSEPGGAPEPQAALQSFESEDERCLQSTCSSLPKPMRVPPLQLSIEKRSPRLCSPSHSPPAPPGSTTLVLDSGLLRHAEETEGRPRVAPMSPARDGPPHRGPQQQRGGSVFSRSRESLLSLEEESRQSDDGAALGEDEAAPKETERGETEGRERERSPAERRIHSAFLSKEETTGTSSTLSSFLGVKPANAERGSSACSILVGALEGRRRRLASPRDFPPPTFERILFGLPCEGDKDGTGGDTAAEEEEEEEAREEEEGGEEGEERAEVEEPREQVRGEDEQRGPREQKRTEERRSGSVPSGEMRSADVREERRRRRRDHKRALVAREVKELKEEPAADVGSTVAQGLSLLPSFFSAMLARGEDTTAPQTAWDVESEVGETPREERVQARSLKRELASPAKRGLSRSASLEATSMRKKLLSLVQSHSDVSKAKQRRPMNLRHLRDLPSLASLSPKEKFRDLIVERPRQRRAPPKRKTAGTSARDFLEESASDGNLNRYRKHAKGLPEGCRLDSLRLPDSIRSAVPRGRFAACSDEEDEGARSVRTDRDLLTSLFELPFASSPARRRLQQVIRRHALFKLYDEDESEPSEARLPEASQPDACGLSAPPGKTKKRDIPRALLEQLEAPKTPVRHTPRIPSLSPSLSAPSSRSSVSSASSRSSVSSASSRSSVSSASAFSPLPSCARSKRKDEEEQKPERNGTEWRDDLGKEKRRRGPHREATKTRRVSDASPAFSPARRRSGEQRRERRAREKSRETEGWNRRARAPQKPIENVLRRQNERVHAPKKAPRSPVGGKTSEVRDSAATEREETGERQTALGRQGRPRKTQRGDRETSKEVNVKTTKGSHERYRDMESPTLRQSRRNVSSSSSPSSISSVSSSSAAASLRGRLKKDTARRRERHRGKDKRRQLSASSVSSAACSSSSTSHERRRTHSHEKRERSKKSERGSTRREQELKQGPQLLEPEFTTEAELVAVVRRLLDQVTKRKHSEADSPSVAPLQPLSNLHAVRAALLRRQQDLEAERRELTASCLEDGDQCGETGLRDTHRDRGDAHRGRRDPRGDRGGDRGSSREQSPRETARLVGAKTSQTGLLFVTLKAPESEKTSEKGGRGDGEDGFRSVGKKAALPHLPFAATRLREVARKAAEWRGGRSVSDFSCDSSSSDEDIPSAFNMVWQ